MTRRTLLAAPAASALAAPRALVVNAAEHAWVTRDPRFPINPDLAVCPSSIPRHDYAAEFLLSEMSTYKVDAVVISHVCYYGRDNSYPIHCVKTWPGKFAAIGLLVGHRLHSPADKENPSRLERLITEGGLVGLRLSPIYDRQTVWLNDPACYPLWKTAERLGAVFNLFLGPEQVGQAADMAARFPGVNIVIDHMAMIDIAAPDSAGFGPLLDLARFPNVYPRTSLHNPSKTRQTPYRDVWPFLRRLYDRFGPRRLVYANFFEFLIMKEMIPFFSAEDREWIMGRTAQRIYKVG